MLVQRFVCPRCRKKLKAAAELVRPKVRCGGCGAVFRVPPGSRLEFRYATPPGLWEFLVSPSRN